MNQILMTKTENSKKIAIYKRFFKIQFVFSLFIVCSLVILFIIYIHSLQQKQQISNMLMNNYGVYKLYTNNSNTNYSDNIVTDSSHSLFGIIEIPKINIYYPIFSKTTEELLKIAPCKFYGNSPNQNGNICIAGHNYNNSLFFSNINLLNNNDEIFIYDNNGKKYVYYVFKTYEVNESDLSPVFDYDYNSKELTLITCNNFNNNRIIVKASQL